MVQKQVWPVRNKWIGEGIAKIGFPVVEGIVDLEWKPCEENEKPSPRNIQQIQTSQHCYHYIAIIFSHLDKTKQCPGRS